METLSLDPLVFSIKDFLSAYEADEIVRCGLATRPHMHSPHVRRETLATGQIKRSTVGNKAELISTRTSSNAWMSWDHSPLFNHVYKRGFTAAMVPYDVDTASWVRLGRVGCGAAGGHGRAAPRHLRSGVTERGEPAGAAVRTRSGAREDRALFIRSCVTDQYARDATQHYSDHHDWFDPRSRTYLGEPAIQKVPARRRCSPPAPAHPDDAAPCRDTTALRLSFCVSSSKLAPACARVLKRLCMQTCPTSRRAARPRSRGTTTRTCTTAAPTPRACVSSPARARRRFSTCERPPRRSTP
jgi:hypothetical protein